MEKSTKILIGVGLLGLAVLVVAKTAKTVGSPKSQFPTVKPSGSQPSGGQPASPDMLQQTEAKAVDWVGEQVADLWTLYGPGHKDD